MALKAGIVGLPNVGKSTLFNALTAAHVEAANYPFATINPNSGIVTVADQRIDFLSNLFQPKKTIYATIEFFDIAGLVKGASNGEGLGNQFLAHIRLCDAIVEVVRCFENSEIIHVENSVDPRRDIEIINLELVMADLDTLNKRLGKIATKARVAKEKDAIKELAIIEPLIAHLEDGHSARTIKGLNDEQLAFAAKNYFLLTLKPLIYMANVAEEDYQDPLKNAHYQTVLDMAKIERAQVIPISAQIESELIDLSFEEKKAYLAEIGASESGLEKLVRATYKLLNLSTYFTVGKDEVRAWTFTNGQTAPECAGIIHSDFERGFIKAEIYTYDDIFHLGSEQAVKENGKLRVEGKEYRMKDGDIVFFRFNV